jgi:hypothetical protein
MNNSQPGAFSMLQARVSQRQIVIMKFRQRREKWGSVMLAMGLLNRYYITAFHILPKKIEVEDAALYAKTQYIV